MKSSYVVKIIEPVLAYVFIALFIYAAGSKWLEFDNFRAQVGQSPLLTAWGGIVVILIPVLEIIIALALGIPRFRLWGLYGFYLMMVMFSAYVFIISNYEEYVPCSCGGIISEMGWSDHFRFNLLFVGLAILAILIHPKQKFLTTGMSEAGKETNNVELQLI